MENQKKNAGELAQRLMPLQYRVTQKEGTEPPFHRPALLHELRRPRFIPLERLEEEGYGQYLSRFRSAPK